jgi:hypothetical protein
MMRKALSLTAIVLLAVVGVLGTWYGELFDAGFAFAVAIHYVRDFLPEEDT